MDYQVWWPPLNKCLNEYAAEDICGHLGKVEYDVFGNAFCKCNDISANTVVSKLNLTKIFHSEPMNLSRRRLLLWPFLLGCLQSGIYFWPTNIFLSGRRPLLWHILPDHYKVREIFNVLFFFLLGRRPLLWSFLPGSLQGGRDFWTKRQVHKSREMYYQKRNSNCQFKLRYYYLPQSTETERRKEWTGEPAIRKQGK